MQTSESKLAFFRQSGWLVIANTMAGVFFMLVNPIASGMKPADEYTIYYSLLRLFTVLAIPASGMQTPFAQQAATIYTESDRRKFAYTLKSALGGTFVIWVVFCILLAICQARVMSLLNVSNPKALWMMMAVVLLALWLPIGQGTLQGLQNFKNLGLSMTSNGIGRFGGMLLLVGVFHGQSASGVAAAFCGFLLALVPAAPTFWTFVKMPGEKISWKPWFAKVIPLTLGTGATLFILNADMLIVQSYFPKAQTAYYAAASIIGVALVTFTGPVAAVMFPKVAASKTVAEKSHALFLALSITALLGGVGALFCSLFPDLPLRIMFFRNPDFVTAAPLVRWIMWAMVPVTLSNVLISNLLAQKKTAIVPWLVLVAIGYGVGLSTFLVQAGQAAPFESFKKVFLILAATSSLLLGLAIFYTLKPEKAAP